MKTIYSVLPIALLSVLITFTSLVQAQSTGDYQSHQTGDWNQTSTWERWNGSSWVTPAPSTPVSTDGVITVLNTHTVTVTANVTADQIIVNAGGQITVNSGVTFTVANGAGTDLSVSGTVQDDGTITGANAITVNNGGAINVTGIMNLSSGNATLTVSAGGNLSLSGTASSVLSSVATLAISGTVNMSGSSTITVSRGNGGSVGTVNSGGLLVLSGTSSVINASGATGRTFTVNSGGIARVGPTATLSGTGEIVIASGASLEIGSADGISTSGATGNVQSSFRTYNVGSNYTYNGAANQNIGNGYPNNLTGILTINNPGNTVTLDNARTIASGGSVVFTSGLLNTSSNLLTLNAGSSVSGASDLSYATGPVKKIGNTAFTFPIGKSGSGYHAIGISAPGSATDAFTAEYIRSSATAMGGVNAPLNHVSACEHWQLDRTTGTSNVSVTIYWTASSPCGGGAYVTSPATVRVARYNGTPGTSTWFDEGASSPSGTATAGNVSSAAAVSTFSPTPTFFTLGSNGSESPLPVKFGEIKGYAKNSGIQVDFTTYTEDNVSRYEVERSVDGKQFSTIGQVAARNSNSKTTYSYFDASPLASSNFYRIRNIDIDGKSSYSIIIRVDLDKSSSDMSIYPNPVKGGVVSFRMDALVKGDYMVKVMNASAQQVYTQKFYHSGGAISQSLTLPGGLKGGVYYLQVQGEEKSVQKMFLIQ